MRQQRAGAIPPVAFFAGQVRAPCFHPIVAPLKTAARLRMIALNQNAGRGITGCDRQFHRGHRLARIISNLCRYRRIVNFYI
jgi:hypothetical protein